MKRKAILITSLLILFWCTNSVFAQNSKVLFVLSAADTLLLNKGEKMRQTGVFLSEFYLVYKSLITNGYQVDFATPGGEKATIDQGSLNDKYWKEYPELKQEAIDFWENNASFSNPLTLETAIKNKHMYIGLVVPGGQGLMVDLMNDKHTPILLKDFAKAEKAIGLICHAPCLITTIPKEENPFIEYTVNSVTPFEEFIIETFIMGGKPQNRKIANQLKKLGLKYKSGFPGSNYAVRDRNLVTSQNPYSESAFNELFLQLLSEKNDQITCNT